jgi:hypothetical protein
MEDHVLKPNTASDVRRTRRLINGGAATVLFGMVLATTAAMTQQSGSQVTETVTTQVDRDLSGREGVSEKVVTHRAQTNRGERVVIETYLPAIEAGRLALSRRVDRVTTAVDDGSQTIEETTGRNPVAASDAMRIIQRSVTTVRRKGPDSYVSEQQVFEPDGNGRLVLVRRQIEQTSRN